MVVIDATMLVLFLQPNAKGPTDDEGKPVSHARERVEYLISELDRTGTKIGIPTPALSETLIRMGSKEMQRVVETLNQRAVFVLQSFDQRAAIEVAAMLKKELGKKRPKDGPETWAKLKYDRQIVAIAKVSNATTLYSDDGDIKTLGDRHGIPVERVCDLPLPPDADQGDLFEEDD